MFPSVQEGRKSGIPNSAFGSCQKPKYAQKGFDSADIVRDFRLPEFPGVDSISWHNRRYSGTHNFVAQMKSTTKKIIIVVLVIFIGLPVALTLMASAAFWVMDKTNGTIVSSGVTRRYLLYVPRSYDSSKSTPLVISIHPAATWPAVEMAISRWNDVAERYGFIVVYPAGSGVLFGGFGPGPDVWPGNSEDVKFVSDLIDKLQREYNVDQNRIYANGMSNGGDMAIVLSCQLPDRIAGVGSVAGAYPQSEEFCPNSKPVPVVMFHGTADKLAPYQGGKSPIAPFPFANVQERAARLAQRNKCMGGPVASRIAPSVHRLAYPNCAANADVVLYTIEGGGHTWPGGKCIAEWVAGRTTDEISATSLTWDFFVEHPRKLK
jgi:polyhydroxybutyrate depolymerase